MSLMLSQIIKKKLPEWNERVLSEDDFNNICARLGVRVMESDFFSRKGEYVIHDKIPFILLKKSLKRPEKIWVAFHELGHHLLHAPVGHKFSMGTVGKMDRQAQFFAAIALMPSSLVLTKTFGEIADEYNYHTQLLNIRKDICDAFPI